MKTKRKVAPLTATLIIIGSLSGGAMAQTIYSATIDPDSFLTSTGGTGNITFEGPKDGSHIPSLGTSFQTSVTFANSSPSGDWSTAALFSMNNAGSTGNISFGAFTVPSGYTTEWQYRVTGISKITNDPNRDTLVYTGSDPINPLIPHERAVHPLTKKANS